MPWRVSTMPAACSLEMASRTTVRLTPNSAITSASVGSLSPAPAGRRRMRSPSASTSPGASVRGRRAPGRPDSCPLGQTPTRFVDRRPSDQQCREVIRQLMSYLGRNPLTPCLPPTSSLRFRRLLLTGAAGSLGRELRGRPEGALRRPAELDIAELGAAAAGEECNARGGRPRRRLRAAEGRGRRGAPRRHLSTSTISTPSCRPTSSAATTRSRRRRGKGEAHRLRQSNHVTGFYRRTSAHPTAMPRPDGHYGLSKGLRREPRPVLLGHATASREPAHRLQLPRAEGPPHAATG